MITTPEIICDVFSFLDKDRIERIQLVSQFWNNVVIRHKNILPLRLFECLYFSSNQIDLYATGKDLSGDVSYIIEFDGTSLSKIESPRKPRYSQLTVDEVLENLNDVVFDTIQIKYCYSERSRDYLLNWVRLVTTKTGGRFRGKSGHFDAARFDSKLNEIFDNYIIVDELALGYSLGPNSYHYYIDDSYIREVCVNPEIVQLPSTPKEIKLGLLEFKENEEVLNFTCNGKLGGANRLTIEFVVSDSNYENFIRQWFELYRTHQNPISLVGKFKIRTNDESDYDDYVVGRDVLNAVKTFLNSTQLRVKYSLETKESHSPSYYVNVQYLNRRCVLHETDSYALVIEMTYPEVTDMSSINASDLNQPPCYKMKMISFCVKSL